MTKDDDAYVHAQIVQIAKHLRNDGLTNADVYRLIISELESWWMHVCGLIVWWIT